MNIGWPIDLTWYKLATDWGNLIAGSIGFAAAIVAVLIALSSERRKAKRELESLRCALGVEVRQYTMNAYRCHAQLKAVIVQNSNSRTPAILVEDKSKLPPPQVYPNAVIRIGEFGDCTANIVLFFNRIEATREAADRILHHPSAAHLPASEVAWAVERLIGIAETGISLFPHLKTGIATEDKHDEDVTKKIKDEASDWATRRAAFGVSSARLATHGPTPPPHTAA